MTRGSFCAVRIEAKGGWRKCADKHQHHAGKTCRQNKIGTPKQAHLLWDIVEHVGANIGVERHIGAGRALRKQQQQHGKAGRCKSQQNDPAQAPVPRSPASIGATVNDSPAQSKAST